MGQNTVTATDANFSDLINGEHPVLVDFWAEWCGPCKMMTRPLEDIAEANTGKFGVAKLNVDDNQQTAMTYGVMSIPTMIVFADGVEKKRLVGARSKAQLEREIAEYL
jgi:thioredoxin 1